MTESTASAADALRTAAGVVRLHAAEGADTPDDGWIAVTGEDRVRWLNGMVTNSVQALTPGDGAYSFLLSAQGRIQGDATVWAEKDRLLLQTSSAQVSPMMGLLDRFIIMDDVELQDVSAEMHGLLVAGPLAVEKLQAAGLLQPRASRLLRRQEAVWQEHPVTLINGYSPLVPRLEVWSASAEDIVSLEEALLASGAVACDQAALEQLRIAEGTPRFRVDIRDRELPQETGQARALHFSKGCYLGQEIVERIRSRGNVHRTFVQFRLGGEPAQAGTALMADEKQVGELTSVATPANGGERLALGYLRREVLERGVPVTYTGGLAEPLTRAAAS